MRKLLLTSTGFDNKKFQKLFLDNVGKKPEDIKALFVPTAANDDESKEVVPFCLQDLTDAGILPDHIVTYNLDYSMGDDEIGKYDAIYFCGGSETYLMEAINRVGFADALLKAIESGLFFIGVSAGSMIASSSVEKSLNIIPNQLEPHCEENVSLCGKLPNPNEQINLSDNQAVWIIGNDMEIIE